MVPSNFIVLARTILVDLITSKRFGGYAGLWVKDRMQVSFLLGHCLSYTLNLSQKFLQNMIVACDNLEGIPATLDEMDEFDASLLKWDPCVHPWFPTLVSSRTTSVR
jgi:N-alpha-acetyltransferase 35, NatC auxiliary subunit